MSFINLYINNKFWRERLVSKDDLKNKCLSLDILNANKSSSVSYIEFSLDIEPDFLYGHKACLNDESVFIDANNNLRVTFIDKKLEPKKTFWDNIEI